MTRNKKFQKKLFDDDSVPKVDESNSSSHIFVPPIKCQGIKTKIVPVIKKNIRWDEQGKWIEPFLGSGVVLFNILPERAFASDTNKHIIYFYQKIRSGAITSENVRKHLEENGKELLLRGERYYYEVRERFNKTGDSLDFLFLNRSCFNGVMRFNSKGKFNVPFCRKTDRFRRPYITKIVNQTERLCRQIIDKKDWAFECLDWKDALKKAKPNDFVYLDPPYIGRHTDYFGTWTQQDAEKLSEIAHKLPCPFILSMWSQNKYRTNEHLQNFWEDIKKVKIKHFYHVGPTESLRNEMEEVLVLGNQTT
jgi:DNA adenine methylase